MTQCDKCEAVHPSWWGGWHYDDENDDLYCEDCAEKSGIEWVEAGEDSK